MQTTVSPSTRHWLPQGRWLGGRDAILQALQARPAGMRVRHVMSNAWAWHGEGGVVHQEAYMTAFRQLEGEAVASLFRINRVTSVWRSEEHTSELQSQR